MLNSSPQRGFTRLDLFDSVCASCRRRNREGDGVALEKEPLRNSSRGPGELIWNNRFALRFVEDVQHSPQQGDGENQGKNNKGCGESVAAVHPGDNSQ